MTSSWVIFDHEGRGVRVNAESLTEALLIYSVAYLPEKSPLAVVPAKGTPAHATINAANPSVAAACADKSNTH